MIGITMVSGKESMIYMITQTECKHIKELQRRDLGKIACSGVMTWVHTTAVSIFHLHQLEMIIAGLRQQLWQKQKLKVPTKLMQSNGTIMTQSKAAWKDHLNHNQSQVYLNHQDHLSYYSHLMISVKIRLTQVSIHFA